MTVLQLVEQAMYSVGASSIPSTLFGNTNFDAKQLLSFVYEEARFLRSQKVFPQCKKNYTFTIEANRLKYPLPQDFYLPLTGTLWDITNKWQLRGPLSDQDFVYQQLGFVTFNNVTAFRIIGPDGNPETIGGQFEIYPQPDAGIQLFYEYITKTMFQPKYWQPSTAYTSGTYVSSSGNIYLCDTNGTSGTTPVSGTTANIVDGTTRWDYVAAPVEQITADTDMCIFDDDIMISGIKWRYEKSKGTAMDIDPNTGIPVIHKKLVENAASRWLGNFVISLADPQTSLPIPNAPEGGWAI